MISSDDLSDALADLQAAVSQGQALTEAVSEVATAYRISEDVLWSRANRPGGIAERADQLRSRAEIIGELNAFEKSGFLFGYPLPDFLLWRSAQGARDVSEVDRVFALNDIEFRRERARDVLFKRDLKELSREEPNAQDR